MLCIARRVLLDPERLRDRRTRDVRIEDGRLIAGLPRLHGHERRHEALADAALAADDGIDVFDVRLLIERRLEIHRCLPRPARLAARRTIMIASFFTHSLSPPTFQNYT